MSAFQLRRFSNPDSLGAINQKLLIAFLSQHRRYLVSRGVVLPTRGSSSGLNLTALTRVFMSPEPKTPKEMIDALYYMDELSTHEGMDALIVGARKRRLPAPPADSSPADVAVHYWVNDQDLVERTHAELYAAHFLSKVRSFETYQMKLPKVPKFRRPNKKQLGALGKALDAWFESHNRGRGARVMFFPKEDGIWFVVRHGEPLRREECFEGARVASVCYRPSKYDIVVYQPKLGELRLHAHTKGQKQLYRAEFGKLMFGSADIFPGTSKYTLTPLRDYGVMALNCIDIIGLESIVLCEAQFFYRGSPWEIVTRKSTDLFALFERRHAGFPKGGELKRATFAVKFQEAPTPRLVVIKPPNVAIFTRDDDSILVEQWLLARGFIIGSEAGIREDDAALAGS